MKNLSDMIKDKRKSLQGNRGRATSMKPGKNIVRILPSWREKVGGEEQQFWHDYGMHFIKAPASDKTAAVYVCSDKTFNKPCEVCELIRDGLAEGTDTETMESLKGSRSSHRILFNAVIEGVDTAPVVAEVPAGVWENILAFAEENGFGFLIDKDGGHQIIIEKTGAGIATRYSVMPKMAANPVTPATMAGIHDLDAFVDQENEDGRVKAVESTRRLVGASVGVAALAAPKVVGASTDFDEFEDLDAPAQKVDDGEIDIDNILAELESEDVA